MPNNRTPEKEAEDALRQTLTLPFKSTDPRVLALLAIVGPTLAAALEGQLRWFSQANRHLSTVTLFGVASDMGKVTGAYLELILRALSETLAAGHAHNKALVEKQKASPHAPEPGTRRPKIR